MTDFDEMVEFARGVIREVLKLPWGEGAGALYVLRSDPALLHLDAVGRLTAMTEWHSTPYQVDQTALVEHLHRARADFQAFEGLAALAAELIARGEQIPAALADFAAKSLRGETPPPKRSGGRRPAEEKPSFDQALAASSAFAVERRWPSLSFKIRRGDAANIARSKSKVTAAKGTVAGIVAEAMRKEGRMTAVSYDAVVKAVERHRRMLRDKFPDNSAR